MKRKLLILAAFAATVGVAAATDAIRCPRPCDVRLEGPLAEKMNRFLRNRVTDGFLRETIFEEACIFNRELGRIQMILGKRVIEGGCGDRKRPLQADA